MSNYTGMKVLELDIETAPHKVYAWGLFKENIYIDRVIEPGYTLCFAATWQHESQTKVQFHSMWKEGEEKMMAAMWALLDEADVVIHYNGKRFDIPHMNRGFLLQGLAPPSNYRQIDLYQIVRSSFKFASNKLDFVSQQLSLGAKVQHKGMDMWKDIMDFLGSGKKATKTQAASMKMMERYNKEDVHLLRRLYKKLQPWIKVHPNRALWMDNQDNPTCPNCGSEKVYRRGIERTRIMHYQRYKCEGCGANSRSRLAEKTVTKPQLV